MIKWIARFLILLMVWNYLDLPRFSCKWGGPQGDTLIIQKLDHKENTADFAECFRQIKQTWESGDGYGPIRQVLNECMDWVGDAS